MDPGPTGDMWASPAFSASEPCRLMSSARLELVWGLFPQSEAVGVAA